MLLMHPISGSGASGTPLSRTYELINLVGRQDFGPRLLRLVRDPLRADLMSAIVFAHDSAVLLSHDTLADPTAEARAVRGYLSGCFRQDPGSRMLFGDLKPGQTMAVYMSKADVPTLTYRRLCYDEAHIVDRLSVLHKTACGDGITVNFYRNESSGPFQAKDLDTLAELALGLQAVSVRHYELMAARLPVSFPRALSLLTERFPKLTLREAQCAAGVITGLTADDIALKLGIKPTSVITHRKRAYQRLDVSGQRELIALFHKMA